MSITSKLPPHAGAFYQITRRMRWPGSAHHFGMQQDPANPEHAFVTMEALITWVEDRGSVWYCGFRPVGADAWAHGRFGAFSIPKEEPTPFGIERCAFICFPPKGTSFSFPALPNLVGHPGYDLMHDPIPGRY
jgi:hypothetical protein